MMLNCSESISAYILRQLEEFTAHGRYVTLIPVIAAWNDELEMPPGCSLIDLDAVVPNESVRLQLIEALTDVHACHQAEVAANKHPRRTTMIDQQLRQIILFLEKVGVRSRMYIERIRIPHLRSDEAESSRPKSVGMSGAGLPSDTSSLA